MIFELTLLHTHIYVMAKFQVWMSNGLAVIAYTKLADSWMDGWMDGLTDTFPLEAHSVGITFWKAPYGSR